MVPSTLSPNSNDYILYTSETSTSNADVQHYELRDILAQLYEHDNQDDARIHESPDKKSLIARLASESSYFDDSAYGIVDSLTLVNCRHLISDMLDAEDLVEGFQVENSGASSTSNETIGSQRHGHRRSGLRRVSIEDTQNNVCLYIVRTKKE